MKKSGKCERCWEASKAALCKLSSCNSLFDPIIGIRFSNTSSELWKSKDSLIAPTTPKCRNSEYVPLTAINQQRYVAAACWWKRTKRKRKSWQQGWKLVKKNKTEKKELATGMKSTRPPSVKWLARLRDQMQQFSFIRSEFAHLDFPSPSSVSLLLLSIVYSNPSSLLFRKCDSQLYY